jgi:hypothetical protein
MWKWVLTIFCDNENHPARIEKRGIFQDPRKAECIKAARLAGWSYGKRTLCPHCNPRNKTK